MLQVVEADVLCCYCTFKEHKGEQNRWYRCRLDLYYKGKQPFSIESSYKAEAVYSIAKSHHPWCSPMLNTIIHNRCTKPLRPHWDVQIPRRFCFATECRNLFSMFMRIWIVFNLLVLPLFFFKLLFNKNIEIKMVYYTEERMKWCFLFCLICTNEY